MEAKKFKNFTNEDFTWKWDGIPFTFPAHSEMFLESDKADHFAKHLVDRELNRLNLPTNDQSRAGLEAQCFPTVEAVSSAEALNLNEAVKEKKAKKKEPEFEDLDIKPRKKV